MEKEMLMKTVVDCSTGVTTVLPFTDDEIAQHQIDMAELETKRLENEIKYQQLTDLKESAKAKLVAGEPLTEEEAATIVL